VRINYPRSDREGWRRFIPSWKLVLGTLATLFGLGLAVVVAVGTWAWLTIDIPEENEVASAQTTVIFWNDGKTELARIGDTNRIYVPISDIPDDMQKAVVAAEDRRFYEHSGFDVIGLSRAVLNNLTGGSRQGGSTITQQYAKNAYLSSEQTYIRKVKELVMALKLELSLSKDEILERYLNTIYFGRGAYGVQTAAEAYFGVDAKDLTLEQSAVLASIINAPGAFSPDTNMEALQTRYRYVLGAMLEEGYITQAEYDAAVDNFPEITKKKESQRYGGTRGFLIKSVEQELSRLGFSEQEIYGGGLRVTSTFDRTAQRAAVSAVRDEAPTTGMQGVRIGLAAVQPVTGEVVAMYGGANYLADSLNNATQATYQAGSTFKPFGLAAATEDGIGLDSLWPGNTGIEVDGYVVNNYGDNSYGELITLLKGTEQSVNTVYVSVEAETGVPPVQDAALRAGIPAATPGMDNDGLTFVLGTASPHTIDIAQAYATFAARGERANATTVIRKVNSRAGVMLYQRTNNTSRTFDQNTADVVNFALQSVVQNGTGAPAQAVGRPVAGKTGTTDFYKSSWFAGYVPQLAAAVSFGKSGENGQELSLSGVGGMAQFYGSGFPARIFTAFMRAALVDVPVETFPLPEDPPSGGGASVAPTPSATEPTDEPSPTPTPTPTPTTPTPTPTPTPTTPTPTPTPTPTDTETDQAGERASPAPVP
jgi:membrane peptidoglycan carboxypeptidase